MSAAAATYPAGLYALVETPGSGRYGEALPPLCLAHHGEHRVYLGTCQGLRHPNDPMPRYRLPRRQPPTAVRVELVNADDLGLLVEGYVLEALRREREDRQFGTAAEAAFSPPPPSAPEPPRPSPAGRRLVDLGDDEP